MRRTLLRLVLVICLAGCAAVGRTESAPVANELGRLVVKTYSQQDFNGTSAQIMAVVQDKSGVLFFCDGPGLISFDGATWRRIPKSQVGCRQLVLGQDGVVYVGGTGVFGALRDQRDGTHTFESLVEQLAEPERDFKSINHMIAHGDTIYAVTPTSLVVWRNGKLTVQKLEDPGLFHVVDGQLYFQARERPLMLFEGTRFTVTHRDPLFLKNLVLLMGKTPDGAVLIGTERAQFHTLRDGRIAPWPTGLDAVLSGLRINRIWQLQDGSLALKIIGRKGLWLLAADGRFLKVLDDTNGLPADSVVSLTPERTGGYWLGLNRGLAHVGWGPAVTVFDEADGLPKGTVQKLCRHAGSLYASTGRGIYRLRPADGPTQPAKWEQVIEGSFLSLHADETGLWAATVEKIFHLNAGGELTSSKRPDRGTVVALHHSAAHPSWLWLAKTIGLTVLRRDVAGWQSAFRVKELDNERLQGLAEAPDGAIWVSTTTRGFARVVLPPGTADNATGITPAIEFFPPGDGHPTSARVVRWGEQLVFTMSVSPTLLEFDPAVRKFVPLRGVDAMPGPYKFGGNFIGANSPEALWVANSFKTSLSESRVHRFARGGGIQTLPQSVKQLLTSATCFHEEPGPDGRVLWVAGTTGVVRVDVTRALTPPVGYAASVWSPVSGLRDGGALSYDRRSVEFRFMAPRFAPHHAVRYRSRLVGEEGAWSTWDLERRREFPRLDTGRYRFEVQARDIDGHLSAPATLAFTILPPWWRTWWAYGGYAAMLGLTIFGSVRLRTRALRKKNEQLEKIVATRTDDLRRQNGELARLHKLELDEKITARLAAEKAQLDVLRYQLNPHFLFNSLTSIRSQIPPALGSARDTLDRLADFCRLTLTGRKAEERTTVGEEIAMLRAYLDIEQTRMGELLSVEFNVDGSLDGVLMPRLLLLPLVENALKYGQATSEDTLGLKISAQRLSGAGENALVFEISNTGTWVERGSRPGIPSTGIGHDNLRERLRRHYPDAHVFTHSVVDGWVRVRLELKSATLAK